MTNTKKIAIVSLGVLLVAGVLGVAAFRSVSAAAPVLTRSERLNSYALQEMGDVYAGTDPGLAHGGRRVPGGASDEDLAAALGITTDELTAAYETAQTAAIDQALEQGLITQAQADELKANGRALPFAGRWSGWLSQNGIDFNALLADALGISTDELAAARTTAFEANIDQAVADGNLTQEQADLMKGQRALRSSDAFRSAMQAAFEAAVKQAVESGVITQAQADLILEKLAGAGDAGLFMPGFRDGGRGGHGMPRGDWMAPDMQAPTSPSTTTPSNDL